MELHQEIAAARKKKGLTQEQLAELTNITVRTIQRLESGESVPRPYTLKAIAAALDTTFEALTGSTPDGHPVASKDQHNTEDEKHFFRSSASPASAIPCNSFGPFPGARLSAQKIRPAEPRVDCKGPVRSTAPDILGSGSLFPAFTYTGL